MRSLFSCTALLALGILLDWSPLHAQQPGGFLVMEMYVVEGCHACHDTEAALYDIRTQLEQQNLPVHVLIYHIDLGGGADPYRKPEFFERMKVNLQLFELNENEFATPQIVFNGNQHHQLGINLPVLVHTLTSTPPIAPDAKIDLTSRKTTFQEITAKYEITPELRGNVLQIALVQKSERPNGSPGDFQHIQIVRDFKSVRFRGDVTTGEITLRIPGGVSHENMEIIAFSQNPITGQIVAVNKCRIDG